MVKYAVVLADCDIVKIVKLPSHAMLVSYVSGVVRYDTMHYIYMHPKADKASLICTQNQTKNSNEEN